MTTRRQQTRTPAETLGAALTQACPEQMELIAQFIPAELGPVFSAGCEALGEFFWTMGNLLLMARDGQLPECVRQVQILMQQAETAHSVMLYEGHVRGVDFSKCLGLMLVKMQAAAARLASPAQG